LAQQQKVLSQAEQEKRELERNSIKVEKDRKILKGAVERLEREKMMVEEDLNRTRGEKTDADRSLSSQEHMVYELKTNLSDLEKKLEEKEQMHQKKLNDLAIRHREEIERECERNKSAQLQLERTHGSRERAHKQRTRGLEEQVNILNDQLAKEMQQKQSFINRTTQKNEEIRDMRNRLSTSLTEVSKNAELDTLEKEATKLNDTIDLHQSYNSGRSSAASLNMATSTPNMRRTKSASPIIPRPDDVESSLSITPTTDPGPHVMSQDPLTNRRGISTSYVSPIRKARQIQQQS
jgi:rootletin